VFEAAVRKAVLSKLKDLPWGELTLCADGQTYCFGAPADGAPRVSLQVHQPRFFADIAFGGSIAAGEGYMRGDWDTDDLTGLIRLFARNQGTMDAMEKGTARLAIAAHKAVHWMRRNTRAGSRRNIAGHYDLGNDFFALFLDDTMMYSSAVFEREEMSLKEASIAKLDRICRKLDLRPTDHVLEIGTGWGGFAIHAAGHYGCRVTTTTISREQRQLALERVRAAGLEGRVEILEQDYRDLQGRYDKLVSIEMIEAVGHRYFDAFFAKCSALLKPEGLMLLQAITIADQRFEQAARTVDFIQRYIFPGGCLPSIAAMAGCVARATDLRIVQLEDIGAHYARTLALWRANLLANIDAVRALGYPEAFIRMWIFYLCYCEGGFEERVIGDAQVLLAKPLNRSAPVLPPLGGPGPRAF
jgi:cyclopropane-fatty-acyl-phospholipid synthase